MVAPCILTHGGAGAKAEHVDGPRRAAHSALELLRGGGSAVDAVVAATVLLEDDWRFNAGTGSNVRLDGETCEMDAAVCCSDGRYGAVACLERVQNPIRVAARVMELPHMLIAGAGATALARRLGFPDYDPVTPKAMRRWRRVRERLARLAAGERFPDHPSIDVWSDIELAAFWNLPTELQELAGHDTVGAVARDSTGAFAASSSTGGTAVMLRGRVGDSPLLNSGLYAGPAGAVTATGIGEEIIRRNLSRAVYERIARGDDPQVVCHEVVDAVPVEISIGVIALTVDHHAFACNRPMPVGVAEEAASQ